MAMSGCICCLSHGVCPCVCHDAVFCPKRRLIVEILSPLDRLNILVLRDKSRYKVTTGSHLTEVLNTDGYQHLAYWATRSTNVWFN